MKNRGVFAKIRETVKQIPKGRVSTYGRIAKMVGIKNVRVVGWAMRSHRDPTIPCHRIIRKDGTLAPNFSAGGWQGQKKRLMDEGICFIVKNQVDLKKHLWKK